MQPACAAVGLTLRTYRRWHRGASSRPTRVAAGTAPRHAATTRPIASPQTSATSFGGRQRIALRQLKPPPDRRRAGRRGRYLASESTFYRLLRAEDQLTPRTRKAPPRPRPPAVGGHRPQPGLDLGHHLSGHQPARDLLLPLPHPGHLQPQDRRLGGLPRGVHRARRRALRARPPARGCRARRLGPALRQRLPHEGRHHAHDPPAPRRRALLQPTLGQQRQPLFRGRLRHPQGSPAYPEQPSKASSTRVPGSPRSSSGTTRPTATAP